MSESEEFKSAFFCVSNAFVGNAFRRTGSFRPPAEGTPLPPLTVPVATNGWLKNAVNSMRSFGFFRSKLRSKSTHSCESVFAIFAGIFASPRSMFRNKCIGFRPVNGGTPQRSSNKITPTLHKSAFASYFWYPRISGAMYRGLPQSVLAISASGSKARAKPKSAIFRVKEEIGESREESSASSSSARLPPVLVLIGSVVPIVPVVSIVFLVSVVLLVFSPLRVSSKFCGFKSL